MPKLIPEEELRAVETVFRGQPEALSTREIASRLPLAPPHRTLQFRLRHLVEHGRLAKHGVKSRSTYSLPQPARGEARPETMVPLSERGARLVALFERPLQTRTPVGYRRELLDSYWPNSSAYLDPGRRVVQGRDRTLQAHTHGEPCSGS